MANCPYCNARHEIQVEKGKNGKPFFMACSKCKSEFAVRFVPVAMYQAQVAGFRQVSGRMNQPHGVRNCRSLLKGGIRPDVEYL
jgi:transposase-like protein